MKNMNFKTTFVLICLLTQTITLHSQETLKNQESPTGVTIPQDDSKVFYDENIVQFEKYLSIDENGVEKFYWGTRSGYSTVEKKDSVFNGNLKLYQSDRSILEGDFEKGLKHGTFLLYGHNGKLISETNYLIGRLNGKTVVYDSYGNLSHTGNYENNRQHGLWTYYDKNKNKLEEKVYDKDSVMSFAVFKGKEKSVTIYDSINRSKEIHEIYIDEVKTQYCEFLNHKKNGKCITYSSLNGKPVKEENYINDLLNGESIKYNAIGKPRIVSIYKDDKLISETSFDITGRKLYTREFN